MALRNGRTIFAGGNINWDEGQLRILLSGPGGETSEEVQRRARAVQKRAQRGAPFRTGTLRYSISVNTRYPPDGAVAEITADADHALVIELGRGEVSAKPGSKLAWTGDQGEVFANSARAVPGVHYMENALDEAGDRG